MFGAYHGLEDAGYGLCDILTLTHKLLFFEDTWQIVILQYSSCLHYNDYNHNIFCSENIVFQMILKLILREIHFLLKKTNKCHT